MAETKQVIILGKYFSNLYKYLISLSNMLSLK